MNERTIPPWELPAENWQFYPLQWQTKPLAPGEYGDAEVAATVTAGPRLTTDPPYDTAHYARDMALEQFHFQGGLVLRAAGARMYRLQLSASDRTIALWKTPENFLAAADLPLAEGQPLALVVRMVGPRITVTADGEPVLDVTDRVDPILRGRLLAGANHARVTFDAVSVRRLEAPTATAGAVAAPAHVPAFAVR